jgi:hypothetical protein
MGRIPHNAMRIWHEMIEHSSQSRDIVSIVQDFVSNLTPTDLAAVPPDCRPGRIRDESDIDFWNLRLADACHDLWGTDRDGKMLIEMSQVFLRASVRVSRLLEPHSEAHS